jgi:hypothetical protein
MKSLVLARLVQSKGLLPSCQLMGSSRYLLSIKVATFSSEAKNHDEKKGMWGKNEKLITREPTEISRPNFVVCPLLRFKLPLSYPLHSSQLNSDLYIPFFPACSTFRLVNKTAIKEVKIEKVVKEACGDLKAEEGDDNDEMEQEEMFVEPHESFEHKMMEWGGPRRGGRLPEPTRYGDWERKGRCSDF